MAEILGLPKNLRVVPEDAEGWMAWRDQVILYRLLIRDECERDENVRAEVLRQAAADPAYDMCIFGAVFEPRDRIDRPMGWRLMIPFHFQVNLLRWIDEIMAVQSGSESARLGRGDGILEKSRDMAGSWTCIWWAANRWKFSDGFLCGFMSYKEELVDKADDPASLFYKLEGCLGLDPRVPAYDEVTIAGNVFQVPLRAPDWLVPEGFDPRKHSRERNLSHPTKTNVISGFTTTSRTGVGARLYAMFLDEAAKFKEFLVVWNAVGPTTDHRLALSSPDLRQGPGFRDLARHAEQAMSKDAPGPAFYRLRADEHPFRDDIWREEMEARYAGLPSAVEAMSREYDLNYEAGQGARIYARAHEILPTPLVFRPSDQSLDFCIDPGVSDMTAFHLVGYDPGFDRYGLLASYANNGLPAEFYASLVTAQKLAHYDYGEDEERIMEWFDKYGRRIRFWVGDPAGKQRGGATATSFYDEFREATKRLTDGRRAISIWSSDKQKYKWIDPRIAALRWMLEKLEVNDEPDTLRTLQAIKEHHWKASRDDLGQTTFSTLPVRTWGHDRVTALEFYACHRRHGAEIEASVKRSNQNGNVRYGLNGKPIGKSSGVTARR